MSQVIQSDGLLSALLDKYDDSLVKVVVTLGENVIARLGTMASAAAIDGAIQRKVRGRGDVKVRKGIPLVIPNEVMDDIINIIKSVGN